MDRSMRGEGSSELVQYYLAAPGLPGAEVALLAGRGALLAHRRFRGRPGYARWYNGSMAKVVLRAESQEIAALARVHDALTIPEPPDVPLIAVFRPRAKRQAAFLSHLKLYSGRIGPSVREDWPASGLYLPIFVNGDLDLSAGKLAAQVAHAALAAQEDFARLPVWSDWLAAGLPLALIRTPERALRELVERGTASGVEDEGRTEVASGSLTAAAGAPGELSRWSERADLVLLATSVGRPAEV